MITFFRHIRQNMINANRASKYLLYAIGEIILVVIGILLALQINEWNGERIESRKELKLLKNLKENLTETVSGLKRQDSTYAEYEANTAKALALFYQAETAKDIDSVMKLSNSYWNDLYINKSTYDEMVNTGSLYTLKDEELQKEITSYYVFVKAHELYIESVNNTLNQLYNLSESLHPVRVLFSDLNNPEQNIGLDNIDTSWISNKKSKTYMALYNYLTQTQSDNHQYRREVFQRIIKQSEKLIKHIEVELNQRKTKA